MSNPPKDFSRYSDDELLRMLDLDYQTALTALYDRYAIDLYIYVKSILLAHTSGEQSGSEAKKIVVDVFISLTYNLPAATTPPFSLIDHLFERTQRMALDHARRSNSKPGPGAST